MAAQYFRPPTHQPVLCEVGMKVTVRPVNGTVGTITLPTPSGYSGQTVIAYKVECNPPGALKDWHCESRSNGLNECLVAHVSPDAVGATVTYTARLLLPGAPVWRTQLKDFDAWSQSSALVQSQDPEIVTIAKKLKSESSSSNDFINRVVKFVAANKLGHESPSGRFDAKSALAEGGNSLARASLCAAILRSQGVAARTIAAAPTWAEKTEAEQWLVECQSEDGNWAMIEPTVGLQYPARDWFAVLDIPSVLDESTASLPKGSGVEPSPGLSIAGQPTSWIKVLHAYPGPSGSRLMHGAFRRSLIVMAAARRGQSSWYDEGQFADAASRGPTNLALFIDGQPTMPSSPRH